MHSPVDATLQHGTVLRRIPRDPIGVTEIVDSHIAHIESTSTVTQREIHDHACANLSSVQDWEPSTNVDPGVWKSRTLSRQRGVEDDIDVRRPRAYVDLIGCVERFDTRNKLILGLAHVDASRCDPGVGQESRAKERGEFRHSVRYRKHSLFARSRRIDGRVRGVKSKETSAACDMCCECRALLWCRSHIAGVGDHHVCLIDRICVSEVVADRAADSIVIAQQRQQFTAGKVQVVPLTADHE